MKTITKYYYVLLTITVAVYFAVSKQIFDQVNETIQIVVDEGFHIPQGIAYCKGNFSYWDPKITTLPGLQLITVVLGYYFTCNTYNLRFLNLVGSCFNLILFVSILKFVYGNYNERQIKIMLQALSLTILPPLYFFSHLYYTETLSLLFLLAYSRLCFGYKGAGLISVFGTLSVVMRQTNIVWVAMVLGHKLLDIFIRSSRVYGNRYLSRTGLSQRSLIANETDSTKMKRYYTLSDAIIAFKFHLSTFFKVPFKFITPLDLYVIIQQASVLLLFAVFLYVNGSIVIGDKKAHEATIHIPQLFYFLLFYGVFGLPYVLAKLKSTISMIVQNKLNVLLLSIIFAVIVHFNTIVHPYILADNRHYMFYIWNRWFGKYDFARYATIPAYIFLLFSLYDNLKDQNCISFLLPYCVCMFFALALQRLVEIRYFLVPYIVLRLRFVRPSFKVVLLEFAWYIAINVITFYIFFTKKIKWDDFEEAQRIIW